MSYVPWETAGRSRYGDRLGFLDSDDWGDDPDFNGIAKAFKLEVLAAVFAALLGPDAGEERRRTLVLVDNAQWLDAPSWDLLEELAKRTPRTRGFGRVVVVLAKRNNVSLTAPSVWSSLKSLPTVTSVQLAPLDAVESSRLLCDALEVPLHAVTPATVENVRRKCAGIPVLILALCESIESHVRRLEEGVVEAHEDEDAEKNDEPMADDARRLVRASLQKVPCFINLEDEGKFEHVAARMQKIVCAPEETLITKGEKGSTIYVLEVGVMACYVDGVKVAEVGAGDVIGERAMLTNSARTATVTAVTRTTCWALERRHARYLIKEADEVWRRVLALESMVSAPARGRVAFETARLRGISSSRRFVSAEEPRRRRDPVSAEEPRRGVSAFRLPRKSHGAAATPPPRKSHVAAPPRPRLRGEAASTPTVRPRRPSRPTARTSRCRPTWRASSRTSSTRSR